VAPTASPLEITSAYRRRVRELHPDSRLDDAASDPAGFVEVLAAYEVLHDPVQRSSYDAGRRDRAGRPAPAGGVPIPVRRGKAGSPWASTQWLGVGPLPSDTTVLGSRPAAPAYRLHAQFDIIDAIEDALRHWWSWW